MIERAFRWLSGGAGDRRFIMVCPLATPALAAFSPNAAVIVLMLVTWAVTETSAP